MARTAVRDTDEAADRRRAKTFEVFLLVVVTAALAILGTIAMWLWIRR